MNIYVGNLSYEVDDEGLREAFGVHGEVISARVIMDRYTGRSRGFGFVEMASDSEAQEAITSINGTELRGRAVTVNEARPRDSGDRRGGPRY